MGFTTGTPPLTFAQFSHVAPTSRKLSLGVSTGYQENDNIEQFISKQCPKIELLSYGRQCSRTLNLFPFRIMESLPAQQVTEFVYIGGLSKDTSFRTDVAFHSHSTTLRKVNIDGEGTVPKVMASALFNGCFNLETLFIAADSLSPCITLADALEYPWACTKLQRLSLAISGCELPVEPGVDPYDRRPTPITLTEVETQYFSRLEDLYQRIGTLTELQGLDLTMVPLGEDAINHQSFPAMLNVQGAQTGRPGFFQLLSGLKKLEKLGGSVRADSDETEVTVGWTEAIWMDQNWSDLQRAGFFSFTNLTSLSRFNGLRSSAEVKVGLFYTSLPFLSTIQTIQTIKHAKLYITYFFVTGR